VDTVALSAVTRTTGANAALKDGRVEVPGHELVFEEVPVLVHAFRRMVRELAYDVCEMAFTTYLCAREHGVRFTALPVFLVRGLHHGAIVQNRHVSIAGPGDLAGRRVGVGRGWTVTTGVWARGILADEYGVDLDEVTWVRGGDEHVAEYVPPANVTDVENGHDVGDLLASGALPAAVNVKVDDPDVVPLLTDAEEAGFAALADRGLYPINHLVVVRDDVLERDPDLALRLFHAFARAKGIHVAQLREGALADPTATDRMLAQVMEVTGDDPLPYGIEPNRAMIDQLLSQACRQGIIRERPDVATLFAAGTQELVA
jgi:4,5-dihydroxyphthalate decarboxylase